MTSDTSKTMLLILNPTAGRRPRGVVGCRLGGAGGGGGGGGGGGAGAGGGAGLGGALVDRSAPLWAGALGRGDRRRGARGVVGDRPPQPPLCRALCRGACCGARRAVAACLPVRALGPRAHPALRARLAAGPPAAHRRLSRGLRPRGPCLGAERRRRGWPAAGANRWR